MSYLANRRVLVIDDDEEILFSIRQILRDELLEIFTCPSTQALAQLEQQSFSVVIADSQTEISTMEILTKAREKNADTICIEMSEIQDSEMLIEALAQNHIYDFFKKPFNRDLLKARLLKAVDKFNLIMERNQLAEEVLKKNRQLENINLQLDERIKERTSELHMRDLILQHLAGTFAQENPFELLQQFSIRFFSHHALYIVELNDREFNPVYLYDPPENSYRQLLEPKILLALLGKGDEPSQGTKEEGRIKLTSAPLSRYNRCLGVAMLAGHDHPTPLQIEVFERLIPLASLLIYDRQALNNLDEMTAALPLSSLD